MTRATPRAARHTRRRRLRPATPALVTVVGLGLLVGPAAAADASPSTPSPSVSSTAASGPGATREELGEARPLSAPGQTLYLQRVKIPPGAQLPDHFHEGTQVARVVKGVLTYDVISGTVAVTRRDGSTETVSGPATIEIRAGESLVETASLAHAGSNAGRRPVVIELAALLTTGAPLATPLDAAGSTPLSVRADLTSQGTTLTTVGENGAVTYGWNRLTGTAADAGGPVQVELLGNVSYTNGSGPFSGFVTFTFADGSVLGTQVQGIATKQPDGTTRFASTLGVLGGTGTYARTQGSGTFTGSRAAALGQPVEATFTLDLTPTK